MLGVKLQALVYDILPSRNAPESGAQSVGSPPPPPPPPPSTASQSSVQTWDTTLSVQTLLRCSYSPGVQSRASTSVRTWKMPSRGNHSIVCTQENAAHTTSTLGDGVWRRPKLQGEFLKKDHKRLTKSSGKRKRRREGNIQKCLWTDANNNPTTTPALLNVNWC